MIVRPPEFIEDRRERELEIAAAEARLADMDHLACPYCDFDIEKSFLRCPSCLRRLKEPCATCGKPLDPRWKICPYCEAEIGQPAGAPPPPGDAAASRQPLTRSKGPVLDRTLILVKPDAFARNLTGEIIARFERKGLSIVALKHMQMDRDLASQHYAEHEGKPFFGELVEFITSGPLVAMVLEGHEAVVAARQVIGATNPLEANDRLDPGRLRARGRPEHGPRLGLERVRRARGEALLPRALMLTLASRSPQRKAILEQLGSSSGSSRRTSRS